LASSDLTTELHLFDHERLPLYRVNEDLLFTAHVSLFVIIFTTTGSTPAGRGKEAIPMADKRSEIASDVQEQMMEVVGEVKEATSGVIELFVLALVALLGVVALGSLLLFVAIF
jgi:hypothetical protein